MSETQQKALLILKNTTFDNRMRAAIFAKLMWPNSPMHERRSNTGNGACKGKGAWLCGGAYLRKLEKKGFINSHDFGYYISSAGKDILEQLS